MIKSEKLLWCDNFATSRSRCNPADDTTRITCHMFPVCLNCSKFLIVMVCKLKNIWTDSTFRNINVCSREYILHYNRFFFTDHSLNVYKTREKVILPNRIKELYCQPGPAWYDSVVRRTCVNVYTYACLYLKVLDRSRLAGILFKLVPSSKAMCLVSSSNQYQNISGTPFPSMIVLRV